HTVAHEKSHFCRFVPGGGPPGRKTGHPSDVLSSEMRESVPVAATRYGGCLVRMRNMGAVSSMDWVRRAGDYRVLVGKRDRLGYLLGEVERARLDELERFFVQDANRRRAPWASREQIRAPIAVVVQVGEAAGQARDISGDGIFVVTDAR